MTYPGDRLSTTVLKPLQQRSLLVAVPAYGGVSMFTMLSLLNLETLLCQSGIAHTYRFVGNEPYIDRVRNRLAAMFLESGCTDMLFVDADIEFEALDVIGLMAADRPVIGASYPRKGLDWAA